MSKNNYKHCIYNANRHAHKIALPYCTWRTDNAITMPPNVYWHLAEKTDIKTCSNCKCFKSEINN